MAHKKNAVNKPVHLHRSKFERGSKFGSKWEFWFKFGSKLKLGFKFGSKFESKFKFGPTFKFGPVQMNRLNASKSFNDIFLIDCSA